MPRHSGNRSTYDRNSYSAGRARRTSRQVHEGTVGTHVARRGQTVRRSSSRVEGMARRARIRRIVIGVVVVVAVAALAIGAGLLAFRGTIGSEMTLRNSDAKEALVEVRSDEPAFALATVELGSVAYPLDNGGPDVIMLARIDAQNGKLALINIPSELQITFDNQSESASLVASRGDAALINALSTYLKVDISHFVKLEEGDLAGMVDALGGVKVNVDQEIDDPRAGSRYLSAGEQTLDGQAALTYLRATNIEFGQEDRLAHQLTFANALVRSIFAGSGNFAARIELIDSYFQTDYALADIESINSWLGGVDEAGITCANLPGYFTVVTNVTGTDDGRYVGTSADIATLFDDLSEGREPSVGGVGNAELVKPSSFKVDIQNGTTIEGAASSAADLLKSKGFSVGDVGNAEQPVFEETLVVYRDEDGLAKANTVIDALGVGRAVSSSEYYTFSNDVLLIIGADNKPVN